MERKHTGIDYTLLFLLFLLMCVSLVAIYSGAGQYFSDDPTYFVVRQLIWYGIGAVVIVAVMLVDFDLFRNFSIPVYAIGMVLLLAVEFFGVERNGAQRWIFGIQPSEFMKIFLILALAHLLYKLTKDKQKRTFKEDMVVLGKILLVSLPPFFLILKQPDLGTALVIGSVIATMLLMSGIRWRILLSLVGMAIVGVAFLVYMHEAHFEFFSEYLIEPHQLDRIYGWLDPDSDTSGIGYQLNQAILGIGSGQLFGAGFMEGMQTQSDVIPEIHTDFVFTVIGEEFGFLGAMVLLVIYFLLFYRMIMISLTCNNLYGSYLVAGVVGLLVFQVFQNIAMTIGLMPITGLALPFISYGGSALLTNMMAVGIVLNVHYRTKNYMFTSEDTFS
ncbi:rod shape-determining protein RodA [Shouchella clausii]|jgi:rod shape determining protein RodA|uniref:Rod shape-determining protein RodA n=1 Tax=Shouchella clausii TaxID=79880 RepID=A0A268RX81_SHOCL|nr:rod shape-determining protein RodA [Shouchella clausii]PAD41450.1 rod shape-determining protein RodA [Bacillus sp. 7520-S]SPT80616.1 cell division protein FtsW [Niallia circulans]AST96938.1 rod shape-determining protein RodA [Shouchella clausii]MBU8597626.1 rod shape-determining protein RodA [Shouchella clausii]MCM3547570.1 rod shape-determining protein RodA [Shouchella clausii]